MTDLPQARDPRVEGPASRLFERIVNSDQQPATIRSEIDAALAAETAALSANDRARLAGPLAEYIAESNIFATTLKLEICQAFYSAFARIDQLAGAEA